MRKILTAKINKSKAEITDEQISATANTSKGRRYIVHKSTQEKKMNFAIKITLLNGNSPII